MLDTTKTLQHICIISIQQYTDCTQKQAFFSSKCLAESAPKHLDMTERTEICISDLFKFKNISSQLVKACSHTVKAYLITNQHPMAGNLKPKAWLLQKIAFL